MSQARHLFCLPYAGGIAQSIYARWQQYLPHLRVHPLDIAGHGRRYTEAFDADLAGAAQDICRKITAHLAQHGGTWMLYGHSMGSMLAYETLAAAHAAGLPGPEVCFLSGRNPLHVPRNRREIHELPDEEFLQEIQQLGGTSQRFFENPELVQMFLPVLRSDYRLVERWRLQQTPHISSAPLVFFSSADDTLLDHGRLHEWQNYSSQPLHIEHFAGDHFFLLPQAEQVCARIASCLQKLAAQTAA
ncbi:alpha/beta fold hydrolase [Massilia sp. W12]|uniref:thioesterase II family protein n=1 Tax=Massilia sp. W12 TaxID=3126507 RepID=UPI0030CC5132